MKLYELTNGYNSLISLIENGEVEQSEEIKLILDKFEEDFETKVENTAKVIRTLELEEKALKEEEDRLKNRRKSIENNIVHLKEYIETNLKLTGKEEIKGKVFTIGFKKNHLKVNIKDINSIGAEYKEVVTETKVNKKAILQHFKETGEILEGIEVEQSKSLKIR